MRCIYWWSSCIAYLHGVNSTAPRVTKYSADITKDTPYWVTLEKKNPLSSTDIRMTTKFHTSEEAGMLSLLQIKDAMKQFEHVILPVHCDAPLHWTVIALRLEKGSAEILEVSYYDWCNGVKESAVLAQRLLSLLTFSEDDAKKKPMELPLPCNYYRQKPGSNDCGFALWQALENACKKMRLESAVGVLPRPEAWRKTLKVLLTSLCAEQTKWMMEEASGGKPKHPVCLPGLKKVGVEAKPLKMFRKEFFICSSCRWSSSGLGCCYCNPKKHEDLQKEKEKRSREMAAALEKALKTCKDLGLLPDVPKPSADTDMKGGSIEAGDMCTP